ncbi:hypothetical protein J22TS1_41980 [Siminovitchia terrae]|nr:hypothetical protein J22TS1_41980 [Siminovitchia terrae]
MPRVGIGPKKILAKMACDNLAKKNADGIFRLDQGNIDQLWKLPVGRMFGVGSRMKRHLNGMGIFTIGGLAKFPVELLKKSWGINGRSYGRQPMVSTIRQSQSRRIINKKQLAFMTLPKDYTKIENIKIVLLELCTEVARRCRKKGYMGVTVSCGIRGADFDHPTGFHRQVTLSVPSNYDLDIFNAGL